MDPSHPRFAKAKADDLVERVKRLSKAILDGLPGDTPTDLAIQAALDAAVCLLRAVTAKRASEACYDLADVLVTMGAAEASIEEPPTVTPIGNLNDQLQAVCVHEPEEEGET